MRADIVWADGAPGPTLVVDRSLLPPGVLALRAELRAVRDWLTATGRHGVTKIGLYGASASPGWDLDYRFVQCLPPPGAFDFRAGCGHSLLACAAGAGTPGPVRVRALTTGDGVVCAPDGRGGYTVRLLSRASRRRLLPTGRAAQTLGPVPFSLVRYGNPYVFVDAAALELHSERALFEAGDEVLSTLLRVRAHAARLIGMGQGRALPKVAAVGRYRPGAVSVRGVTTDGWHPSLALTGTVALAAASALPGTVPHGLLPPHVGVPSPRPAARTASPPAPATGLPDDAGDAGGRTLRIVTPGGPTSASPHIAADGGVDGVTVYGKRVRTLERGVSVPWRIHVTA